MKNMDFTEPASMSRLGNPDKDMSNPKNLLNPEKGRPREDISRLFGDLGSNPEHRLARIDALNNTASTSQEHLGNRYRDLTRYKELFDDNYNWARNRLRKAMATRRGQTDQNVTRNLAERIKALDQNYSHGQAKYDEELKRLLGDAYSSKGATELQKYVNFHESLQRAKDKGGLKKYIGEGLYKYKGKHSWSDKLIDLLAPSPDQAIADLLEKHQLTGAHNHLDKELIKQILADYHGNDEKIKPFVAKTLEELANPKRQSSGLGKTLSRIKTPLAAGAGIAAGGAGMYALVKALQNQVYSKDKTKEWKRTLLKSRGEFDRAEHIK
jgi:hypothetical protein